MDRYTKLFIIIVTLIVLAYDVFVIGYQGNNDASISAILIEWSRNYPLIPFATGVVIGHLFWGKESLKTDKR